MAWLKNRHIKKNNKQKTKLRYWVIGIILFLTFFLGIRIIKTIKNSIWDGEHRINVVISGEKSIYLTTFNKQGGELTFVEFPTNLYLEVSGGYGKYRVAAIPELAKLEKKQDLAYKTVGNEVALLIDGWINNPELIFEEGKDTKSFILKTITGSLKEQGKTNLGYWDLLRLWWNIKDVKSYRVETLDLKTMNVFIKDDIVNQDPILLMESMSIDSLIQKYFIDSEIRKENLSLEVLNGTSTPGLGEEVARKVTNSGGAVMGVNNYTQAISGCLVLGGNNHKNSYTVRKLLRILGCRWGEKKEGGNSDLSLIVGEN